MDIYCPKCATIETEAQYREAVKKGQVRDSCSPHTEDKDEYLRCKCLRCDFLWDHPTIKQMEKSGKIRIASDGSIIRLSTIGN